MKRSGINSTLMELLIEQVPSWVKPYEVDGWLQARRKKDVYYLPLVAGGLQEFLSARTDWTRLIRASEVSKQILQFYDMAELDVLRGTVQSGEMLREIPYARQTDHSAHTLYVFLLGIALYLHNPIVLDAVNNYLDGLTRNPVLGWGHLSRFLHQWCYASLLHDVGYAFQDASATGRRVVDRYFRLWNIRREIQGTETEYVYVPMIDAAVQSLNWRPDFSRQADAEDVLDRLRYLPWGNELSLNQDSFDTLHRTLFRTKLRPSIRELEQYAYSVATSGYAPGEPGVIDHAVASGLFLLMYSTFWYWLSTKEPQSNLFVNYRVDFLNQEVIPACLSTAAHNMPESQFSPRLAIDDNPLLFLSILCDEIQRWDRFPVGRSHLVNLPSFETGYCDSESLTICIQTSRRTKGRVTLTFPSKTIVESVERGLGRLANWGDVLTVRTA